MTEEQELKANAQKREFPETMEILQRLRNALAAKLFQTPLNAAADRENIYLRVQTLDAMIQEMEITLTTIRSEEDAAAYTEQIATTGQRKAA